jgi:hypothetical protein
MDSKTGKIYKKLYEIYSGMVSSLYHRASTRLEYRDKVDVDKKEEKDLDIIKSIGDKESWERYGTCGKEEQRMIEFLNYLLNDEKE